MHVWLLCRFRFDQWLIRSLSVSTKRAHVKQYSEKNRCERRARAGVGGGVGTRKRTHSVAEAQKKKKKSCVQYFCCRRPRNSCRCQGMEWPNWSAAEALHRTCAFSLSEENRALFTSPILLMSKCGVVDYAHAHSHTHTDRSCCLWINRNPSGDASSENLCTEPIFTEPRRLDSLSLNSCKRRGVISVVGENVKIGIYANRPIMQIRHEWPLCAVSLKMIHAVLQIPMMCSRV